MIESLLFIITLFKDIVKTFFAFATKNSWDEDVFQLTTGGILTIVALIVILIAAALFIHSRKGSHKLSTKQFFASLRAT